MPWFKPQDLTPSELERITTAWEATKPPDDPALAPLLWRQDHCERVIAYEMYENGDSEWGWTVGERPVTEGGGLRAESIKGNRLSAPDQTA